MIKSSLFYLLTWETLQTQTNQISTVISRFMKDILQ